MLTLARSANSPPAEARRTSAAQPKLAVYFAPDFTEVTTIARAHAFLDHGFELTVMGFRRGRYNRDYQTSWQEIELGRTEDGRYLRRLLALCGAVAVLSSKRKLLRRASVLYARNLDQLCLALIAKAVFNRRALVAYEVLDIPGMLARRDRIGATLRAIERRLLGHVWLLVVSSPGFIRNYFAAQQGYAGRTMLIENKLHPSVLERSDADRVPETAARPGSRHRWVVGYFGLIRGERTFDLITRLAKRLPDVLFYFRGVVTTIDQQHFLETVAAQRNMTYDGGYAHPDDLAAIYAAVDFVWALDLEREDDNSRWLMPCRFYEAGLFGVPSLAARGFEVGDRVDREGIGWTFEAPYEAALTAFFEKITRPEYDATRQKLADLPPETFVSGDDTAELCRMLDDGSPPAARP